MPDGTQHTFLPILPDLYNVNGHSPRLDICTCNVVWVVRLGHPVTWRHGYSQVWYTAPLVQPVHRSNSYKKYIFSFFIPIFAKISTTRSLDRFELTEPKYKTKKLTPYELCLMFCQIDFFLPKGKYSASCRTRYYTQERWVTLHNDTRPKCNQVTYMETIQLGDSVESGLRKLCFSETSWLRL